MHPKLKRLKEKLNKLNRQSAIGQANSSDKPPNPPMQLPAPLPIHANNQTPKPLG